MKKILWLVVARSGSKGIPNKNIKFLGGKPLLAYRIESALNSIHENDIWISTDSLIYAELGKKFGATIPFIRPAYLATDQSSSMDVVLHAMDFANAKSLFYEYVGLLEPTSPFITTHELDTAVNELEKENSADSIVAVRESRPNTLFIQDQNYYLDKISENIKNIKMLGRQMFNKQITPSGGFYISKWDSFQKHKTFYTEKTIGFNVTEFSALEIDEPIDFEFAEFLIEKKMYDKL